MNPPRRFLHPLALLSAALLLTSGSAFAQDDADAELDALFETWDRPGGPGLAVAVVEDGELIYSRGYGEAQLEYGIPIGPETVFHVASVSKQFTAMCVLLLAEEGKLSLDDEVTTHLAGFPDFGVSITIRHLLHHTSGLRDQWQALLIAGWRLDDVITREQVLTFVGRQRELNFPPGARHQYCNTGYTLLSEIVARVSGQPFPEFAREHIFAPLEMHATHFHDDHEQLVPNRAYSYQRDGGEPWRKSVLSYANVGATSLFTTAEDLCRWLDNLRHQRVGGPDVLAALRTPGVLNDGTELRYAAGVVLGRLRGFATVEHAGADAGFRSQVLWVPEHRLGIAVIGNDGGLDPGRVSRRIADHLLREHSVEAAPSARTGSTHTTRLDTPPVELSEEQVAPFVGTYATAAGFALHVEQRSGRLRMRLEGQPRRRLLPESGTEFRTIAGDRVRFLGEAGAGGLELKNGTHVVAFARWTAEAPPTLDLAPFAGRYESPELETTYTILLKSDALVLRHFRHGEYSLTPHGPDAFVTNTGFLQRLEFSRGADGAPDGFRVQADRVQNLRFDRRD